MPKTIVYPDPNGATTIGAAVSLTRIAVGATGVAIVYAPANGDTPFETTVAVLTAGSRTNLATIMAELDAALKAARAYI
jgi:hypothetical protein